MLVFQKRPFHSIRAIIFDMDGTLIDSIDVYYAIIRDIMECFGMEMTYSREGIFEILSEGKKLSDIIFPPDVKNRSRIVEQFKALIMERFKETFSRGKVKLIDEVSNLLGELRGRGFSLGIVTSSMTEVVVPFLKARNLYSYLDCVIGRTEIPQLKPSPAPLLRCMEILQVEPPETIYVGDSAVDIQAGKAAGAWTVGVLTGSSDLNRLRAEAPDAILHSVGDLLALL
jgi:HAD superfamily hydrolase (TIGR01549 family)